MSSAASPIPTVWLAPPPGLLPSTYTFVIEPASIAISAILATSTLIFISIVFSKKNKSNFLDDTGGTTLSEQPDKRLTISGPLDDVLRRNGTAAPPIPRLWSGFSSSNEEIQRVGELDGSAEAAAAAAAANRRTFELANSPARMPNTSHNATLAYPPYPVELDILLRSPEPLQQVHHPFTYNTRPPPPPPPPLLQRDIPTHTNIHNSRNNGESSRLPPPPRHPSGRGPRSNFGDDSTVVGDKAEVETLRSDLSFPDTDSDAASYEEGRWKAMESKDVGLMGRHWE
jgi:hypothetical protein